MEEQQIIRREAQAAPGGLRSIFEPPPGHRMAHVAAGVHSEQLPVADMTVREIRARLGDRFDIDPRSQAAINGRDVGDDEIVRAGQMLTFAHRSGEKGSVVPAQLGANGQAGRILIEGETARTLTPEGHEHSMALAGLFEHIMPREMGTGELVLPDGFKAMLRSGRMLICVHQIPPRIHSLKWISAKSAQPFGTGASYRTVQISLPYLVVLELFGPAPGGRLTLLNHSECFFRREPLELLDDELLCPALLNCSKFDPPEGKPFSWICTQHLDRSFDTEQREDKRLWKAHRALMHCLLETGFNLSSEHHEGNSWFSASQQIDPRIKSVEAWEEATRHDPLFVLEVPWLRTQLSVRQMAERMFKLQGASRGTRLDAANLVRVILNQRP